jgi:hypothetical protein
MKPVEVFNRKILLKRQAVFIIHDEIQILRAKRDVARALEFLESRIPADDSAGLNRAIDCAIFVSEYLETI